MKNLFITLEGIDGVGKSTIAEILTNKLQGKNLRIPSSSFSEQRKHIENNGSKQEKFDFYISCIKKAQEELQQILETNHVICDRYIHSTFAYQSNNNTDFILLQNTLDNMFEYIKKPDYTFLFVLDEHERIKRIKERERITGHINIRDYRYQIIKEAQERFMQMNDLIKINISKKTPSEISKEISNIIGI